LESENNRYFFSFAPTYGRTGEVNKREIPSELGKWLEQMTQAELSAEQRRIQYWQGLCVRAIYDIEDLRDKLAIHAELMHKPQPRMRDLNTGLSVEQRRDYETFMYKCCDKVHISATIPIKKGDALKINGSEIKLGDSLFALFLRFVVELKKKKGGWVNRYTLQSEGFVSDAERFQVYSLLRTALEGILLDKDARKFIENDGSKNYRISTHPDFITYDKKKLRGHPDGRVREIAKKLR